MRKGLWFAAVLGATCLCSAASASDRQPPDLGLGLNAPEPSPIEAVAMDMTGVVRDLNKLSTGKPTQAKQEAIVSKLDELIKQLDKECQCCCNGGSRRNPKKPANASTLRTGPGGKDLHGTRRGGKDWAALPAHEREKVLQTMTEGYPAEYQRMIERYHKRLAEEKPAGEGADAKKPVAKPASK